MSSRGHVQQGISEDVSNADVLLVSFSTIDDFKKRINEGDAANFTPPGKLVHSYSRDDKDYEICAGSLADPEVRKVLDRIQIFVSFFIEGGTPIETDDFDWTLERWIIYFVYVLLTRSLLFRLVVL